MAKADWLTLNPESGSGDATIVNSASKYEGREARSTDVTSVAIGVTPNKTYTVVQEGVAEFIEIDSISTVPAEGGTVTITGRSNAKGLTIESLKDGDNIEASVTLSESYTAGGQTTLNGAEISGDPGATGAYEFAMDITVGTNSSASVATAIIRITGSDSAQVSTTLTQAGIEVIAILVNAADSNDIHNFASCADAATYATENSDINWELTIKSGTVPSGCFRSLTNLVTLTLEEGVTFIGSSAFQACTGFTGSLTIPSSVTRIDALGFYNCGFTGTLTISEGVTSMGSSAFSSCSGFTGTLTIPSTLTSMGESAFSSCSGFTSLIISEGATTIGTYAFNSCTGFSGSLTIPASVVTINTGAFIYCTGFDDDLTYYGTTNPSTSTAVFPSSVFSVCKVPSNYEDDNFCGLPIQKPTVVLTNSSDSSDVHEFYSCEEAATYVTENGSTNFELTIRSGEVPAYCFKEISNVTSLTLEEGVTSIGRNAFESCPNLTGSLAIPNSVTSIGAYAFWQVRGFTGTLTLPDALTHIGEGAFTACNFTGSLSLPNTLTDIGNFAFSNCTNFTGELTIGEGITNIPEEMFSGCSGFTGSLTIPSSVVSIGNRAFFNCGGFTGTLTIPDSVTTIGYSAFNACAFTGSLIIPGSVTEIGYSAFNRCSGFDDDLSYLGTTEPTYGVDVFNNTNFTKCKVNSDYDSETFCGLPVEKIVVVLVNATNNSDIHTFESCEEAAEYVAENSSTNWELTINHGEVPSRCFRDIANLVSLTLKEGVTGIGELAFSNCLNITGVLVIPEGVTNIGDCAFFFCSGFSGNLTLPSTLISIGESAFESCTGLTGSLTIPASVTDIGPAAFQNCSSFDNDLSFLGITEPTYGTGVFNNTSIVVCKVPSGYTGETFCGLIITKSYITVTPDYINFDSELTSYNFTVLSVSPWTVTNVPDIFQMQDLSGAAGFTHSSITREELGSVSACQILTFTNREGETAELTVCYTGSLSS